MSERVFPVLWQGPRDLHRKLEELECPRSVPWGFIEAYRSQCLRRHDQTPERLAERGGLAPEEILVVTEGTALTSKELVERWHMPPEQSVPLLKAAVAAWMLERTAR